MLHLEYMYFFLAAPSALQKTIAQFFPFILLFGVLYLLWIRPEQKKAKQHREMIQQVRAGNKVITSGGLHGTVTGVTEQTLTLQVAENVEITLQRGAITKVEQPASEKQGK